MTIQLTHWSEAQASKEIKKRFTQAQSSRKRLEDQWLENETAVYGSSFHSSAQVMDALGSDDSGDGDSDTSRVSVGYTFKNFRFVHSQLSANPPSVAMRPASSDQSDVRKADAADRVIRHMIRKYDMQENVDLLTLNAVLYGTGILKTSWNPAKGDITDFDESTGVLELEGDIDVTIPHTRNIFLDPDARQAKQIKWVIERLYIDFDEAIARWPEKKDQIEAAKIEKSSGTPYEDSNSAQEQHYNSVELLEYWETGLPSNGYMGKYCLMLAGGTILEPCRPSPFRFVKAGSLSKLMEKNLPEAVLAERIKRLPQMASLPFHILTDIDVSNSIYGKSFVEYAAPLQRVLGQIDSAYMDNIRAHGVARLVIPDTAEVDLDLSNSPWDVTKVSGNQAPYFTEVPNLMPEMTSSRQNMITGITEVAGNNESMFGQQSREQSGASMQYATNQGNMIRRRLFNKYVLCVESIYKGMLDLARKHWTTNRVIRVLGKEKAFEALSIKGTDIDGGYDVVGEYGVTLSLDPITRRQEIMQLQPMFEKAGVPTRMSLKMMKLNDLEGIYDKLQMAEDRQREIFEEMSASEMLIAPEEYQDHENMIAWALDYFMTAEFKYLPEKDRILYKQHIKDRIAQAAQEKSGGMSAQPQAPGPAGMPGEAPPAEPVIPGAPATPEIVNG